MTKNFTITSVIFNEIESVDLRGDFYETNYHELRKMACLELDLSPNEIDSDENQEVIDREISEITNVNRVSIDGILYHALLKWHNRNEHHNLNGYSLKVLEYVRSAVLDNEYLYYVTGCGYDTISADLLGGTADGQAKYEFLEWLNS